MKKGIIMEIHEGFLTLLTPEGEFLQSRKQNQPYSIGEEIYFFPFETVNRVKTKRSIRNIIRLKTVWIAMAALMIFIGTFIPMYQDNKAYAYMSIDANPSVELGVNKKMQVVKLTGFNKEGKEIISHLKNWKKEDVSELTKDILSEMKKGGYLNENTQLLISTVRIEQPVEKIENQLQKKLDKIEVTVNKEKLDLIVSTGTEKQLEKAHKQGITIGKYQYSQGKSKQENWDTVEKKDEKISAPAQSPSDISIPSGQSKKPSENNGKQSNWDNGEEKGNWDRNTNSPGYLKKMEEGNSKQNQGQYRKHNDSQSKNNEDKSSNHSNNYRQNNNYNHNNNNDNNPHSKVRNNERNDSNNEHEDNGNNNRKNR
ncbi:anti-sigma factor domain-containing protein [Neobacillus rhizosphaerae]|uniref:anti-sigma factor domain-containing protein n=1 Tax=Neobacillus rhizosphaerae TaxID=2880965 RepID=UPI003D2B1534